jgi:predicted transcriptional regulator
MTFKHPNLKDTVSKNVSHINYIATRSGVDKTLTETDLKKELEKGIEHITSDDETYLKYIDERPRSHGLFGQDGMEDPKEVQEEISNVKSFVWRSIVSLKEDDAKRLGYLSKDQWQDMLRKKIPDMANEMGIPITNLRWVGAVHMEKGHPHAHVMLWEKEPKKTIGVINNKKINNIRKMFTDEVFEEERFLILNEKNAMRDLLKDLAKNDVSQAAKLVREVRATGEEIRSLIKDENKEGIAPRLYNEDELDFVERIKNLGEKMPGKGRANLKFMPEDVKEEVRSIADYLLEKPEFSASLVKNLNAVEELTRLYTSNEKAVTRNQENYKKIVNILAKGLKDNGLSENEIMKTLKNWTLEEKINLDSNIINKTLNEIDYKKIDNIDENIKADLNVISLKLLEKNNNFDVIKENFIQNINKELNAEFNDLLEKDLIKLNNDNTYSLSETLLKTFSEYENLDEYYKKILDVFSNNSFNSFDEVLNNSKIKSLLFTKKENDPGFELKKYDATIIKGYFGENNHLNFKELKDILSQKYKLEEKQNKEYEMITKRVNKLLENNIVKKEGENYSFTDEGLQRIENINTEFEFTSYDANVICNYIDKSDGFLTKEKLLSFLKEEYKDSNEIKSQYNYLINRLKKNVDSEYLKEIQIGDETGFELTDKGIDKREEIMNPESYTLKKELDLLIKKGFITGKDGQFCINNQFRYFMKNDLINNIRNNEISLSQIEEGNKKYIDDIIKKFEELETNHENIKKILKLKDAIDPIEKARENAYKDIRDRICQIILKGAVESQKDNLFYVDQDLSRKAVNVIKSINNQINLVPEQTKVLNQMAVGLIRTGHTDEEVLNHLSDFTKKENIEYPKESIQEIISQIRESGALEKEISPLYSSKKMDFYLSSLKLAGYSEGEAFSKILKETIKDDSQDLEERLKELREDGMLKKEHGQYKLTNKGIDELLKIKTLDKSEKALLTMLESNGEEEIKATFKQILDNKEVFNNLYNKDPEEFKVGKFDLKVKEEFGEQNELTFNELEKRIYDKYTNDELETNVEKAEKEFDFISKRIEKLCINGYIELNKESGIYSFTKEGLEELANISEKMEFTRYDATVTLNYMDKAENNVLAANELHETLHKEVVNQTAKQYYARFTQLLESDQVNKYISIDDVGRITSTEEGKWLSINLNKLNKYFYQAKGSLTEEKLKNICVKELGENADQEYQKILKQIQKQVNKGDIVKDEKTGAYKIDAATKDVKNLLHQIYKEGGSLQKDNLKEVLEKNIPNREAESQYKYLIKRLENLKKEGYLAGNEKEYTLTEKGIEKREDLLIPERELLKNKLKYLLRLGLVEQTEEGYKATEKYYKYMKGIAAAKEQGLNRTSEIISKDIYDIIDKTQDKIDVGKIERTNERIARGKYYNNEYEEINTDYQSVRSYCNIGDTTAKVLKNLSTTLLVSGIGLEETKDILNSWNVKSNSNIDPEKIDEIIEKTYEKVNENNLWGKTTIISTKEWKEMFESFGLKEKETPKWIYKGENWKSLSLGHIINDIWKSAWRELERQRMQTEAQAEMIKKNQIKQQALSQSKAAWKEEVRKNKAQSMYKEEELER